MIAAKKPDDEDENPGGLGGPDSIQPTGSRDTRLIRRAIEQRWPVADEYRKPLIDRQVRIAIDPNTTPREATNAFRAVLSAEGQNQADEHKVLPSHILHRHEMKADDLDDDDLRAIIDGRFSGGSSGGAIEPPNGTAEPT